MQNLRINNQIRAKEVRLLSADGENLGIVPLAQAIKMAEEAELDLIEISSNQSGTIARIADYGKYLYEQNKKQKKAKQGAKPTETKSLQIKVGTGEHDLELKAKTISKWLSEGHRVKIELFLRGRVKYLDEKFLKERLERVLHFITESYKVAEDIKKSPKGLTITLERNKK
ncbi:translation initiation factor IF-3 [Candidatus Nomurabacteria bacterium]|nr:translation initiation factor IF-3 [Candidatus Nomurabacteria bacterium]MCB9820324.1 translation initiation factor IF-3 [Candidatus Nomurabacteria bacterium]